MIALDHAKAMRKRSWLEVVANVEWRFFSNSQCTSLADDDSNETVLSQLVDELINKVDHGYLIEETGEHAEVPRFARTYLKSAIANGDV